MRRLAIFALAFLVLIVIGCSPTQVGVKPTVIITAPANGNQFREGEEIAIQSTATSGSRIVSVELFVDGMNVRADAIASNPSPNVTVTQRWKATPGVHTIGVRAFDAAGTVSDLATIVISVSSVATATLLPPTVTVMPTPLPVPITMPTPVSVAMPTVLPSPTLSASANVQRALMATVRIVIPIENNPGRYSTGSGSVLDAQGTILTNYHVARDTKTDKPKNSTDLIYVYALSSPERAPDRIFRARVLLLHQDLDLAVLRIIATERGDPLPANLGLTTIPVGNSDNIQIGDSIHVIGYPGIGGSTVTYTSGTVSGFYPDRTWIKTDTEINPGNSGGLAINESGELIGVPTEMVIGEVITGKIGHIRPISLAKVLIEQAKLVGISSPPIVIMPLTPTAPTRMPATATPYIMATPAAPPGIYVTAIRVEPSQPKNGQLPTFHVTFLNTIGSTTYYNWYVKIFEPDKKNSFGETAKTNSTLNPGYTTIPSVANWKAIGTTPCKPYFARAFYVAPDKTILEFPRPGGEGIQQYFEVCQ